MVNKTKIKHYSHGQQNKNTIAMVNKTKNKKHYSHGQQNKHKHDTIQLVEKPFLTLNT